MAQLVWNTCQTTPVIVHLGTMKLTVKQVNVLCGSKYIGAYETQIEAAGAYNEAARDHNRTPGEDNPNVCIHAQSMQSVMLMGVGDCAQ